jgi:glycosyltransferase involved in cell wall biosynthesis
MRLAYYSPLPPSRSGIADYSALLLPALRERIEVVVAEPRRGRRAPAADLALYHVGNDPEAHGWIVEELRERPGIVVLHDFVLHHLVAGLTLGRKDGRGYLDALERDSGLVGRLLGHAVIESRLPPLWETRPQDFPLTGEVLATATHVIVHSDYVADRVRAAGYAGPVLRIAHPAWPVPAVEPAAVEGSPVVGCFGHVNDSKRIPHLISAFVRLHERRPEARLLLVGPASVRFRDVAFPEGVVRLDYVPEDELWALMAACDVCVNLRSPTMGETSGSVIRALSLGKPVVVSDLGWFAELPEEVALKVAPDEHELDALADALDRAVDEREERGAAARAYAERAHALDRVADEYAAVVEEAVGGAAVTDRVLHEVAAAAAAVGISRFDPATVELAGALREIGISV